MDESRAVEIAKGASCPEETKSTQAPYCRLLERADLLLQQRRKMHGIDDLVALVIRTGMARAFLKFTCNTCRDGGLTRYLDAIKRQSGSVLSMMGDGIESEEEFVALCRMILGGDVDIAGTIHFDDRLIEFDIKQNKFSLKFCNALFFIKFPPETVLYLCKNPTELMIAGVLTLRGFKYGFQRTISVVKDFNEVDIENLGEQLEAFADVSESVGLQPEYEAFYFPDCISVLAIFDGTESEIKRAHVILGSLDVGKSVTV